MENLMCVECTDDGFKIQGADKAEVAKILQDHAKKMHQMDISIADAEKKVMPCS